MKKFPVEMLDEYIRLQSTVNDHQIRCVIRFDSILDENLLKSAITRSIENVPLLSCKYSISGAQPYWEEVPFDINQALFIESDNNFEDDYPKYFSKIATENGPQIIFHLIHQLNQDIMIINVNHMVFDGSGFKAYLYLLASLYSEGEIQSVEDSGVRSMDGLLKNLTLPQQLGSVFRQTLSTAKTSLFTPDSTDTRVRLATLHLDADQVNKIKSFCHGNHFTLNDFVLSIFAYSLFKFDTIRYNDCLPLQMMVDLRRYATQYPVSDYANFSSMESITLSVDDSTLIEIAGDINRQTSRIKSNYPGIKNVFLLNTLFQLLPIKSFDSRVTKTIQSLGVSTSNLGVIDSLKLSFADCLVKDCVMFTSIKNQPGLQLTFSSFRDALSLSILGNYSKSNWLVITELLENMNSDLQKFGN